MNKKPHEIAQIWRHKGYQNLKNGIPAHPEFVFRLSGEWQGWSDFLGTPKGTPQYEANAKVDDVESEAYRLFQNCVHNARNFH